MFESLHSLPVARRWRQQGYPVASVLALIRRESRSKTREALARYLLIQRQAEPYAGKWALVGGRWEFGETLETAVTREVKEETGLDTTFVALRGVVDERIAPGGQNDDGAHFLLFVCELSAPLGQAREQSEGPVAWFSEQELKEMKARGQIISSDYAILARFGGREVAVPYVEADVVAGQGEKEAGELLRFE